MIPIIQLSLFRLFKHTVYGRKARFKGIKAEIIQFGIDIAHLPKNGTKFY